jgi:hypothetical protein
MLWGNVSACKNLIWIECIECYWSLAVQKLIQQNTLLHCVLILHKFVTDISGLWLIDWLFAVIDYLRFYVPPKNFSLIWRRHHCRRRAAKFRPMFGAQGLWAGRDLYHATPAVTRDLGLIRYQFWCTRCAFRLIKYLQWYSGRKFGNSKAIVKTVKEPKKY